RHLALAAEIERDVRNVASNHVHCSFRLHTTLADPATQICPALDLVFEIAALRLRGHAASLRIRIYHFVIAVWRAKAAESAACKIKVVPRNRRLQSCNNLIVDGDSAR